MRRNPFSARSTRRGGRAISSELVYNTQVEKPEDILDVLLSWGDLWMWDELTLLGDVG